MADIPTTPVTREEQYLNAMAGGAGSLPEAPVTRTEQYLAAILENGGSGGGSGGGTTNYNQLLNKPKINGVELSGNKTSTDLGINTYDDTSLAGRISVLENEKADKSDIPSPYDDTAIVGRIEALENNPATGDFEYVSATEAESWFN